LKPFSGFAEYADTSEKIIKITDTYDNNYGDVAVFLRYAIG
jgi:hypothetical protein